MECNEEDELNKIDAPLLETIYLIRNEKYISSYQKGMLKLKKNEKEILLEKTENEEEKKKLKKDLKKINSYLENENYYIDLEKQSLEKIISLKNLKSFDIGIQRINNDIIGDIKGINESVTEATIDNLPILYNLQNKFPNLSKLYFNIDSSKNKKNEEKIDKSNIFFVLENIENFNTDGDEINLHITENTNSKVTIFKFEQVKNNNFNSDSPKEYKFYCHYYEKLEEVTFILENDIIKNLKYVLPIFNDKCQIKFKNLKKFEFQCYGKEGINNEIILNLYNNLHCMENLETFKLCCFIDKLDIKFYVAFLLKIISLKLKRIYYIIKIGDEVGYLASKEYLAGKLPVKQFEELYFYEYVKNKKKKKRQKIKNH